MIKSFETGRLRTCSWRRKGDNSRAREKRRKISRSCSPYIKSLWVVFACRTPISNWIDRCFGQRLWNSVHSLSGDNPRIPTNPLSGSQQLPLLWGQWVRTNSCSKLTRALRPCLIQTEVTFQFHRTWRDFLLTALFGASYTTTFCDRIYHMLVCNTYIWGFLCAYICVFVRKWSYTWE